MCSLRVLQGDLGLDDTPQHKGIDMNGCDGLCAGFSFRRKNVHGIGYFESISSSFHTFSNERTPNGERQAVGEVRMNAAAFKILS